MVASSAKRAFSLVELSIVLVILGLLVGGILSGQSLIRASELRAVGTESQKWITAANAFRDKYMGIPGDMTNATSFWGAAHATPATCLTTVGTGTQTCNGDGDGILDTAALASQYGEYFTFWQHLANAGLIEGSYSGISGSGGATHATVNNTPASKLGGGRWFSFNWNATFLSNAAGYDGPWFSNLLQIGGVTTTGSNATRLLKPEEAWNLDKKIDDGRPAYGKWKERLYDDCTDATSTADLDSDYLLTETAAQCLPLVLF